MGEREISFNEAFSELEEILRRIEKANIDVDSLVSELKKAVNLLNICRSKLRKAEVEINQILETIENEENN